MRRPITVENFALKPALLRQETPRSVAFLSGAPRQCPTLAPCFRGRDIVEKALAFAAAIRLTPIFPRSRNASEPFPPHRFRRASHSRRVVGSDTAAGRRNLFGRFGCDDRHYQHETKRTRNSPCHLSTRRLRETQISRKRHSPPFSDLDINYNSRSS